MSIYFYVIKGTANFDAWKSDATSTAGIVKQNYGTSMSNFMMLITESDDYYFTWENTNTYDVQGSVTFNIKSETYDTSNFIGVCALPECTFELIRGSSQCVVIQGRSNFH